MIFIFWLFLIIGLIIFIFIFIKTKMIKVPNVFLITGAVKTGKSLASIPIVKRKYRSAKIKYFIKKYIFFKDVEKPMLFSNIHLRKIKYNLLSLDVIKRTKRVPYGSICFIDEASLLADSMSYKNEKLNEEINLFLKLFGHETRGGYLIMNTQSISDLHYGIKRCINSYLWIHSRIKLPFITILKVRELIYSDDSTTSINVASRDVEDDLKLMFVLNRNYKYYDAFCYSIFTDNLPIYCDYDYGIKNYKDSLKTDVLISFRDFKTDLMKGVPKDES